MQLGSESGILEELLFRESVGEALALLTPEELLLAAGRAAGLSDRELADRMGIEECTVRQYLGRARHRIMAEIPELRVVLAGRRRPRHARHHPDAAVPHHTSQEETDHG